MTSLSLVYALQSISVAVAAATPYQVMVIDRYNDASIEWSKAQVTQMGGGQADPRQLFGYLSIGEAEDYRPYWQSSWFTKPPAWLGPENPQWKGNYAVKFWDLTWQTQVKGYLDGIMAQGFDGVFFDVVDVYQRGWVQQQGRANPAQDMVDLVKAMSDYAKSLNPDFQVYVNNAEELLANTTYLNAIDGVLKESLYYTGGQKNSASDVAWSTRYLDMAKASGRNVSVIDYVSDPAKIADVRAQATADGYGYYTSNLELRGINLTGFSTTPQGSLVPNVWYDLL
ncbi:MJ1477/TM1410 family putative glycoside hydrolase [Microvirga aerophila]|uniref:Glycoside-hydrolase family GH114 TIM-barrel domain-containing protein n=1 Tax=Microvirga aerophila TaxID=670291 RepID=A0A512C389_9HYPH|nr:MJ1477/TM1410 family putative glycoside hydrolase [Microvirga aerophila]GEO18651.1 hypothetical protein MAE02_63470 [Microvirga aerophila]